jgi:diguanylate cyclase (GGDEF)-like protein
MISHLGRYEIIDELGRGAMGIVYKAHDPLIGRAVAIKAINLEPLSAKEKVEFETRFYQEAKAAGHLNHPNIVTIYDLGKSGDIAYIAMELMQGRELQDIIDKVSRLSIEDALDIAIQVASGLSYAHQHGIIHRDIKPTNIMVLGNNHAKIADFGIAKMPTALAQTRTGLIIGSPLYMSPEQIESRSVDARSDIFSLGIVLYQMLTGRLPFMGETPSSVMFQIVHHVPDKPSDINPQVTEALDAIVFKCLAKNPEDRYKNAAELAENLRLYRDERLRAKAVGAEDIQHIGTRFSRLKRLATPGGVPQNSVIAIGYFAMVLTFLLDFFTDGTVQLHLLYVLPLVMIGFHSEKLLPVRIASAFSLIVQGIIISYFDDLSVISKIALLSLVLPSNLVIVYISRVARANFLEVTKLASYDGLTGLRHRLSFESIADMEVVKQQRNGGVFSFAHIDVNSLKELNESRGYLAGDQAIKLIAQVIQENIRETDTAARIGGDEFGVLMPNTDEADCKLLCQQFSQSIASKLGEAALPISTSIGYVTFQHAPTSISEIFLKAENAMHAAQASGEEFAVSGSYPAISAAAAELG